MSSGGDKDEWAENQKQSKGSKGRGQSKEGQKPYVKYEKPDKPKSNTILKMKDKRS